MSKWVIRSDPATHQVGNPIECFDPDARDGSFKFLSIEEGIRSLIRPNETVIGSSSRRLVMIGATLVGYIEIYDALPV
jgi:hypothetical protein